MGRVLTSGDEDWPSVEGNLSKDRKIWMWMTRILIREGEEPEVSGLFYKAVVHAVFLLGADMWVLNPHI